MKKVSPRSLNTEGETVDQEPGNAFSWVEIGIWIPALGRYRNLSDAPVHQFIIIVTCNSVYIYLLAQTS
jgi:hypothetical protein